MSGAKHWEQDKDSTLYVGNLDERCGDALVWELMLQAGPVINVHLPKDRVTQTHQGYGFVEFGSEEDADYAAKIMNQVRIWGKPIRVNKASADKRGGAAGVGGAPGQEGGGLGGGQGVGAELFVGNLNEMVDEKVLFDTFSRFGPLLAPPKVARDEHNLSKGYGFISYSSFDHSDDAIANMHGQYLMNKEITVQYAYKKDGKGERHGDTAERALAAEARKHGVEVQIPAMPASLVMPSGTPTGPSAMANGVPVPAFAPAGTPVQPPRQASTPQAPPGYAYSQAPPPMGFAPPPQHSPVNFGGMAPPPQGPMPGMNGYYGNHAAAQQARQYTQSPLQAPPAGAGLPTRPPPSVAGYGGPQGAPGMPGMPPPPPNGLPPMGMPPPPGAFRPPSGAAPPNGFPPPPGGR
ncbi:RNA-binding domain-containing protein [Polychaeton citri CBS 116435]|uniref:RNA-binding domain-containing protein n=1 Tax=Polychaeton citri CBS 116435 TaxID=1314669 RepID=A0A9P4UL03_9PEZI|nr:RNA-binding domain-containing protein [Polychaeton citri CBS 116435]